jgi:hypothetical protein
MHEIGGDLSRGRPAAEDPVDAEVGGGGFVEPRTTDHEQRTPVRGERLPERGGHLLRVVHVGVALGHDLGDEDGVRPLVDGALDELRDGDLGTEVHDLDLAVVLQALLPREPFDVEDRVDPDGVRVRPDAGADDDELAPQPALDRRRTEP